MSLKIILLTIAVFILASTVTAQRSKTKIINKEIGFKNDDDFNGTTIPDKWKDESAVILCQKYDFSYVRYGLNHISFNVVFRKRVFINDKKSKDDNSIYYFIKSDAEANKIGYVVEKPDGRKIEIDLSTAVDVGANEVSSAYRSYYSYNDKYKKIAIPNLEVGDIIDYYVFTKKNYDGSLEIDFPKFSYSLSRQYPILKQKFFFNIDKGFKVNYRAFNNAPEIVQGKEGVNKYGKSKKGIKTYTIEDEDRDKFKAEIWKYNTLEEPWIKFQVYYVPGSMSKRSTALVSMETDLINEPIDIETIKDKILKDITYLVGYDIYTIDYMRRYQKKVRKPEEVADLVYYYLRYKYYSTVFAYDPDGYSNGDVGGIKYMRFTNTFKIILKKLKVPFKYVIAVDRGIGGFDNVIFNDDVTTGIKVGDKYYFYFTNFSSLDMIPDFLIGTDAIEFSTGRKDDKTIQRTVIPSSNCSQNSLTSFMSVRFNETMDTALIVNRDSLTGLMKSVYQRLVLKNTNYFDKDKSYYSPTYIKEQARLSARKKKTSRNKMRKSKSKLLREQEEKRLLADKKEKLHKWREDYVIDFFDSDYKVTKLDSLHIISNGRLPNNTSLVVEEYLQVEEVINKAGRNYILNIGKLIGYQMELDKDDMIRNADVNRYYAKEYNYNIVIEIPEGYHVENVDALNINVSNDMGEFISSARIDGNKILFNTTKKYKVITAPKEEWSKFIAFIEAAYDISQKKIIIKKVRK